ncbi:MAG: PEP-CTERM system TPR-repeat protein PrsT [Zoogloeaceae bacterium]|nr:PEP-CTERM system TPR-repeat protein PrsT [Zoogloeaceae bacterium]
MNKHKGHRARGLLRIVGPALIGLSMLTACGSDPDQMIASARQYIASNDRKAAEIQLKNALQEVPNHAEARFLLGQINVESGDYAGAVKELERAREAGYPEDQVVPALALAMLKAGEGQKLLDRLATVRLEDPVADGALQAVVGDALARVSRLQEARVAYNRALAVSPTDPRARIGLARIKAGEKDYDEARSIIKAVLEESGQIAEAHELLAGIAMIQSDLPLAMEELRKAIAVEPKQPANHFRLVSLLIRQGELAQAREALDDMTKATGGRQVYALYLNAYLDFLEGKDEEALNGVSKVVGAVPDFLPARLLTGAIHLRKRDFNQTLQHLGVVLTAQPDHPVARRLAATAHLMARNPGAALDLIEPMLNEQGADGGLLQLAGQAYLAQGDFDKSAEYFSRALEGKPEDTSARIRLGVSRIGLGESEQGMADLAEAARLDEQGIRADIALSMARLKQGKIDQSLEAIAGIERKQPDNPLGPNLRGGALLARGDTDGARKAFEQSLEKDSAYLPAAVNLARLDLSERKGDEARERLAKLVRMRPGDANARLALVDVMAKAGADLDEIEAELRDGVKAAPDAQSLKVALVRQLSSRGKSKEALAVAQEAQIQDPDNLRVLAVLGGAQLASGQAEQAVSTFGRLASENPTSKTALLLLAGAQTAAGNMSGADQTLQKARLQFPNDLEVTQALVAHRLKHRDFNGASSVAEDWRRKHEKSADGYLLTADVAIRQSDWQRAIDNLEKAQTIEPRAKTAIALHAAFSAAGDDKAAAKSVATWIRDNPDDLAVRGYLAESALRSASYDTAVRYYKDMIKVAPKNALLLNNLAWAGAKANDPKAQQYAETALELAPDNPAILDTVGMLSSQKGDHARAVELLQRASDGAPKSVPIALNLARALAKAGEADRARALLDRLEKEHAGMSGLKREAQRIRATL